MMIESYPEHLLAAHHYRAEELMREADTQRLAKEADKSRPAIHEQMLARAGDWLISAGTTLKARVDAPTFESERA
jgi:hypothetical protein